MSGQNCSRETRAQSAQSAFSKTISHIHSGPIRHVAVGPECVLAFGSAGGIEERWLRREHKRPFGMLSLQYQVLRLCDLIELFRRDAR